MFKFIIIEGITFSEVYWWLGEGILLKKKKDQRDRLLHPVESGLLNLYFEDVLKIIFWKEIWKKMEEQTHSRSEGKIQRKEIIISEWDNDTASF